MAKRKSNKALLKDSDLRVAVLEMVLEAHPYATISSVLNVPVATVKRIVSEGLQEYNDRYLASVERLQLINIQRLEMLLSVAMPRAMGTATETLDDGTVISSGPPDRHWIRTVLDIIKSENDLIALEYKQQLEARKSQDDMVTSEDFERAQQTLISGDELYEYALSNLSSDGFESEDYLSMDNEGLILAQVTDKGEVVDVDPTLPKLDRLNKKVEALTKTLGLERDDDDDDTEEVHL